MEPEKTPANTRRRRPHLADQRNIGAKFPLEQTHCRPNVMKIVVVSRRLVNAVDGSHHAF